MENPTLQSDKNKLKRKRWIWFMSGCLVLTCLTIIVGGVILLNIPKGQDLVNTEYSLPTTVHKGDEFDLIISMKNTTSDAVFIRHIMLRSYVYPSILDGVEVISTEPEMKIDETLKENSGYSYFREISPRETQVIKFHLRAQTVGTFSGPISAYAENPDKSLVTEPVTAFYLYSVSITIAP